MITTTVTSGSSDPKRSLAQIYAEIEALQCLGGIENWEDRRPEAQQLLNEWLDLPDDTPEEQDLTPLDPRAEWLWDQLEPLQIELKQESEPEPLVFEVDQWISAVVELLREGWQQFERFQFHTPLLVPLDIGDPQHRTDEDSEIEEENGGIGGDLAVKANQLWMQHEFLDPVVARGRSLEICLLHMELEAHIDPEGELASYREQSRNEKKAKQLEQQGKHELAAEWRLPKDKWKRPRGCSQADWANIIKPFNRKAWNEQVDEFLAKIELSRYGLLPGNGSTAQEALKEYKEDAHTQIRELIKKGASNSDIQQRINTSEYSAYGLARYAEQFREELERQSDLSDALENLLLRGKTPVIYLADYFPAEWLPMFRVLRDGLKFSDEAIVMTVMAAVAAMLPPSIRVRGWSLEEIPSIWLFHVGSSGTAKSVLLRMLVTQPMSKPIASVDAWNKSERQRREKAFADGEKVPPFRKRNLLYTAPSTQGIRADLAEHGAELPGLLVRDELNGWLKQMADNSGAGVGDVEFWLSSYDGAYSNDVFADSSKSREVRAGKLSVIGGIQPKVFLEQLEAGNANGFNSRPLFVHLPRVKRELVRVDEATDKLKDQLGELYLKALKEQPRPYVMSSEAERLFEQLFNQLEELSIQANNPDVDALWAKGPGQILRVAASIHFIRLATGMEKRIEAGIVSHSTVISARSLQLAANLVMSGKTRAVELQERAANPQMELANQLLESLRKRQCKVGSTGVRISDIRKGWNSRNRPKLAELNEVAVLLQSRGLVQLLEGGQVIRLAR